MNKTILIENIESATLTGKDVNFIYSYVERVPFRDPLEKVIENNIKIDHLKSPTLDIITKYRVYEQILDYFKSPCRLDGLPLQGNLFNELNTIDEDVIKEVLNLTGYEQGKGIGKGEILISLFFEDCTLRSRGDIDWNGKYLEVKGYGARLGGDRAKEIYPGVFPKSLSDHLEEYEDDLAARVLELETLFPYALTEFKLYKLEHVISDNELKALYVLNYMVKEKVDRLIVINTSSQKKVPSETDRGSSLGDYVILNSSDFIHRTTKGLILTLPKGLKISSLKTNDLEPQIFI